MFKIEGVAGNMEQSLTSLVNLELSETTNVPPLHNVEKITPVHAFES